MGWWVDKERTQWARKSNETMTCKICGRGVTPQRHRAHEVACEHDKHIKAINHQQRQLEANVISQAISDAKRNCLMNISEQPRQSGLQLFPLNIGILFTCFCCMPSSQ
jgi:hypothetical protein